MERRLQLAQQHLTKKFLNAQWFIHSIGVPAVNQCRKSNAKTKRCQSCSANADKNRFPTSEVRKHLCAAHRITVVPSLLPVKFMNSSKNGITFSWTQLAGVMQKAYDKN